MGVSKLQSSADSSSTSQTTLPNWLEPVELHQKLGLELLEAQDGCARARLPVAGNTQVSGVLHGGATALLIEATAGYAAISTGIWEHNQIAVGTEISISHIRPAREGVVEAKATPIHLGKSRMVHQVEVHRSTDSQLVSIGTVTHAVVSSQN